MHHRIADFAISRPVCMVYIQKIYFAHSDFLLSSVPFLGGFFLFLLLLLLYFFLLLSSSVCWHGKWYGAVAMVAMVTLTIVAVFVRRFSLLLLLRYVFIRRELQI